MVLNLALNNRLNSQRNKAIILNTVRMYPGVPRARLAETLNLSRTAITDLVDDLIQQGLLVEGESTETQRGRRPVKLQLARGQHFFLAMHFSGEWIRAAVIDHCGAVLASGKEPFNPEETPQENIQTLDRIVHSALQRADVPMDRIEAIGCGVASHVDIDRGVVQYSENLPGWNDFELKSTLEKEYSLPCYLETGRRLFALAEKYYGRGRGVDDFVYLHVDVGLSLGIFAGGILFRGRNGGAGEIGHIQVQPDGPLCNCGKLGCLERIASSTNIVHTVTEAIEGGARSTLSEKYKQGSEAVTAQDVAQAAEQGDVLALRIVRNAGREIATVLVGSIQTLNPELIVMGGPIFQGGNILCDEIKANIQGQLLPYIGEDLRFEVSALDYDESIFLGALVLISEQHYSPERGAKSKGLGAGN